MYGNEGATEEDVEQKQAKQHQYCDEGSLKKMVWQYFYKKILGIEADEVTEEKQGQDSQKSLPAFVDQEEGFFGQRKSRKNPKFLLGSRRVLWDGNALRQGGCGVILWHSEPPTRQNFSRG